MDLNLMVVCGRLATAPELRMLDSGETLARLLITVRSEEPKPRIDVLPVTWWKADDSIIDAVVGQRVWVSGAVQRRFWEADEGRRSRIELVAEQVCLRLLDVTEIH